MPVNELSQSLKIFAGIAGDQRMILPAMWRLGQECRT
jgi:hypothetical protein